MYSSTFCTEWVLYCGLQIFRLEDTFHLPSSYIHIYSDNDGSSCSRHCLLSLAWLEIAAEFRTVDLPKDGHGQYSIMVGRPGSLLYHGLYLL